MRVLAGRCLWKPHLKQFGRGLGVPRCFCGKSGRTTGGRAICSCSDLGRELDILVSGFLPHKLDGVRPWGISLLGLRPGWTPSCHPAWRVDGLVDPNVLPLRVIKICVEAFDCKRSKRQSGLQ